MDNRALSAAYEALLARPPVPPLTTLTGFFIVWKVFILFVSSGASTGPDYDTSTSLFFEILGAASPSGISSLVTPPGQLPSLTAAVAGRLTRWDAIYFAHGARVGYVYEQEWAFSPTLALFLRLLAARARTLLALPPHAADHLEAFAGVALAHASHYVAVLALYRLTLLLSGRNARLALLAAFLSIVSPAGVFLSAPYAEAPFSALSFVAFWILAAGYGAERGSPSRSAAVVVAGAVLGLATAVRSNGLASGLLFAVEAVQAGRDFVQAPGVKPVVAAAAAGAGGVLVALGSVIPQYVAYMIYCDGPDGALRPWCAKMVPSIYSYVQEKYWNVGFLRYWTPNQIPLFILAAPVLTLLIVSGWQTLRRPVGASGMASPVADRRVLVQTLAASQGVVALLALTSYHVQVISRLASGYAVWYWWIAACLMDKKSVGIGKATVTFMMMYAGIQAVLFSAFLPPA
ncbi:hypothetical protein PWT90_00986 [Aphanocladium album]|nr:hypothetical protein PWT90_00986 [Aphanocladium album]